MALVTTNQPHAINYSMILKKRNTVYGRQGWWMKKIFGEENVRIVVLNWFDYNLFDGSNFPMTGDGHWDAAFELLECRPFAIDLNIDFCYVLLSFQTPFTQQLHCKYVVGYRSILFF